MLLWLFYIVLPCELLLNVVPPPAEFRFRLLLELNVVPVNLNFYLDVASGVSLLLNCLLLLHWVNFAEDLFVVVVVNAAVVAVLNKLLLGHLIPDEKVPPALVSIYWLEFPPVNAKFVVVAPPVLLLEILELNALFVIILLIIIYY